jgi:uncharacterized protein
MTLGRVFVDTGGWIALQAKDDEHHPIATASFPHLLASCELLATSNLVIGETYTLLRMTKGYRAAQTFLDTLARSPRARRIFITEGLEAQAYQVLHRYADHPFSFVDATSFALMRHEGIRYAFAFDAHFAAAGFVRIPVDLRLPA